mmetsp:Transcript_24065/g.35609  ORF Transcript_24065/g.35609 Transcript_24065/m.35609 type:complete len:1317 (+) Transcript_24065:167-4117(+)
MMVVPQTDQSPDQTLQEERPPNPLLEASCISQLTFSWPLALIKKGAEKTLEENDIPDLLDSEDSTRCRSLIEREWREEVVLALKSTRRPSLHRALLRLYHRKLWFIQPAIMITSASRICQALTLGKLIEFFEDDNEMQAYKIGYLWAFILIACAAVPLVSHHQGYFRAWRMGMQLRIGSVAVIYEKSLKLVSMGRLKSSSAGELINLASNDVDRFLYASLFISYLFWAPVEALVVLCVGLLRMGPAFFAGYVVLFTFVPLQFFLGKQFAKFRLRIAECTDRRVNFVSQVIQGVRLMKMSGWELKLAKVIDSLRQEEVKAINIASRYRAINEAIFFCTSVTVSIVIFIVHLALGNQLTPRDVFTTFTLINLVQFTMTKFFAYAVMSVAECIVSVTRIQEFWELPEVEEKRSMMTESSRQDMPAVLITGVSCYWNKVHLSDSDGSREILPRDGEATHLAANVALRDISLRLERGKLYCVIGQVGCGKSALLSMLAGELEVSDGSVEKISSKIAYVGQGPWIMDGTVKENIIMGKPIDQDFYSEIINACGLRYDIEHFPSGDNTFVGDRGVRCSGGQRARIGLARALYQDAELVLLDDPLSAVDSKISKLIFQSAIQDMCVTKGKCVVLATHQYQLIGRETCILMKQGNIIQISSYEECVAKSGGLLKSADQDSERAADADAGPITNSSKMNHSQQEFNNSSSRSAFGETKSSGSLSKSTYTDYISAMGGQWVALGILTLFLVTQGTLLFTITTIGKWAEKPAEEQTSTKLLILIAFLGISVIFLSVIRSIILFFCTLKASRNLHDAMTLSVLRAKIEFFDTNPLGRILNRFSADVGSNDDQLPASINDTFSIGFIVLGAVITAAYMMPFLLLVIPFILCYFGWLRYRFVSASRELKRLEGMARSPVYAMMSESINGIASIRANGAVDYFRERFAAAQNIHSRTFFSFVACTRWLNFRLELLFFILLSLASLLAVVFHTNSWFNVDPAILGLSLTLLLQMSGLLQWAVRQSCEAANHMVAVERLSAYGKLEPEAPLETEYDNLFEVWPTVGCIDVQDLTVRYRESLPPALTGVSFHVEGGQRVGVVGRSGAGKSSLLQSLFRIIEAEEGNIAIDKADIAKLGLHRLRRAISVIQQTPVLFSGCTLRENLDPFGEHSSADIIDAISAVQLQAVFEMLPEGLDTMITEGTFNFSAGERQLFCVARAILENNNILILDEPTANVDRKTDRLLQEAILTSFEGATIFAIAHRLETVIGYDRILVIGDGKLLEYGPPNDLLKNLDGAFSLMVADTGTATAFELHQRALEVSNLTSRKHNVDEDC